MDNRNKNDKVLQGFHADKVREYAKVPMITIYNSPEDYPGKYVARLWDLHTPTPYIVIADTLDEARAAIPTGDMIQFSRDTKDDLCIVETWV